LDLIEKLLDAEIGEESKLLSIKESIQNDKKIGDENKKYLMEKFEHLKAMESKPQTEDFVSAEEKEQNLQNIIIIQKLQKTEIGNSERLLEIKNTLEQNKKLSIEDDEYFKEKYQQLQKIDEIENKILHTLEIIEKLQKEEIGNSEKLESIKKTLHQRKSLSKEDAIYFAEKSKQLQQINSQNNSQPQSYSEPPTPRRSYNPEYKSEGTTMVLSIVLGLLGLCGVGHMYVGKVGKGVGILILGIILFSVGITTIVFGVGAIFLIIFVILFIWQIVNSRKLCFYYNSYLDSNGERPW